MIPARNQVRIAGGDKPLPYGENRRVILNLQLLQPVCRELAPNARLHIVEGADHSFHVLKRSDRTDEEVLEELSAATRAWADELSGASNGRAYQS